MGGAIGYIRLSIEFIRSADNGSADPLSQLPLKHEIRCKVKRLLEYRTRHILGFVKRYRGKVKRDGVLNKKKRYALFGWPSSPALDEEAVFLRET